MVLHEIVWYITILKITKSGLSTEYIITHSSALALDTAFKKEQHGTILVFFFFLKTSQELQMLSHVAHKSNLLRRRRRIAAGVLWKVRTERGGNGPGVPFHGSSFSLICSNTHQYLLAPSGALVAVSYTHLTLPTILLV